MFNFKILKIGVIFTSPRLKVDVSFKEDGMQNALSFNAYWKYCTDFLFSMGFCRRTTHDKGQGQFLYR